MDIGTVLGVVGVIAAIFVPLYIFRKERKYKGVTYHCMSVTNIFKKKEVLGGEVEVRYRDEVILSKHTSQSLFQASVKIENSGTLPIEKVDYAAPLFVCFDGVGAEAISAEVLKKKPSDLDVTFAIDEGKAVLEPTLLNPGDWVEVQILGKGYIDPDIKVTGRISGVGEIRKYVAPEKKSRNWWDIETFVLIVEMIWLLGWVSYTFILKRPSDFFVYTSSALGILTFYFFPYLLFRAVKFLVESLDRTRS